MSTSNCHTVHVQKKCGKSSIEGSKMHLQNPVVVRLNCDVGSVQVLRQFEAAKHAGGPVRDHRPLCLNLDDHIRVCSVVKGKGNNFRSLPGVVTHEDGQLMCSTCCHCMFVAVVVVVVIVVVDPGGKCLRRSTCKATGWCANSKSVTYTREQLWPACT